MLLHIKGIQPHSVGIVRQVRRLNWCDRITNAVSYVWIWRSAGLLSSDRWRISALQVPPGYSVLASLAGFAGVMAWRVREGRTAVTARKILIPPLGMATGFCMFAVPAFRVPIAWALAAFVVGAIALAYPLLLTSTLERQGDVIMMKRSGAFFAVVVVLAAIRYIARDYLDHVLSIEQTGGLFFILAFGMILRWRTNMFRKYRELTTAQ